MAANNLLRLGFLEASRTIFLACDVQEAFRKSMSNFNTLVLVANRMSAASKILNVPLYVSEQYPRGLGPTTKDFNKENAAITYDKTKFSMATPILLDDLKKQFPNKLDAVVLFGLEAHVCVEQTAMDFRSQNIDVHILADGCISRSQQDRVFALQRLRDIGCHITTSESVLFKLMKDKEHPQFKEISKLVREPIPDSFGFDALSKL
ncbi:isochorismatase domain-containing protein 2-like [Arctopsyche grandis]|uniref:isochorismatase domain-containing protein 2-like n=1 Tax=Arctopsyche grandis TaxID=121162 RepID=UPI00406DA432